MPILNVNWHWIDDFTVDTTLAQLRKKANAAMRKAGVNPPENFRQAVYVIRTKTPFAIQYPSRFSPTLYIGEGNLLSRLIKHRDWLIRFQEQGHAFEFEVAFCLPRLAGNRVAYKDFEAFLLFAFKSKYGALPLRNKQNENTTYNHQYSQSENVIGPTSGVKYRWAIQPLPANAFRAMFHQTGVS